MLCLESRSHQTGSSVPWTWRQTRTGPEAGLVETLDRCNLRPLGEVNKAHSHKSNTYILLVLHSKYTEFFNAEREVCLFQGCLMTDRQWRAQLNSWLLAKYLLQLDFHSQRLEVTWNNLHAFFLH